MQKVPLYNQSRRLANKVKAGTATQDEERELHAIRIKLLDEHLKLCRQYQYAQRK